MQVKRLADKNSPHVDTICTWLLDWWGNDMDFSPAKMREYTKNHINEVLTLPQTYGLFDGDKIVGLFMLSNADLDVRPDIYPWLINAYICEEYRGQGNFNTLMSDMYGVLSELSVETLYLYTFHKDLYEKYGFKYLGDINTYINNDNDIRHLYSFENIMSDL